MKKKLTIITVIMMIMIMAVQTNAAGFIDTREGYYVVITWDDTTLYDEDFKEIGKLQAPELVYVLPYKTCKSNHVYYNYVIIESKQEGLGRTFNRHAMVVRIDHILYSEDFWEPHAAHILDRPDRSDHNAVTVHLRRKK